MAKILNDKYYTPTVLAKYCIDKTYEIIGENNIIDIIEPSAGSGAFSNQIDNCIAYDLYPEGNNIIEQDYILLNREYKPNTLVIGNPPFGRNSNLIHQFMKKSMIIADYISFILPSSYIHKDKYYQWNKIYTEDFGEIIFSDKVKVSVALIIYKRGNNTKPIYPSIDYTIKNYRRGHTKQYDTIPDIIIDAWGNKQGQLLAIPCTKCAEEHIYIHNNEIREKILEVLTNFNWRKYFLLADHQGLTVEMIHKVLMKYLPNIR